MKTKSIYFVGQQYEFDCYKKRWLREDKYLEQQKLHNLFKEAN